MSQIVKAVRFFSSFPLNWQSAIYFKVFTFSHALIKMGMLLQPYSFVSSVQVKHTPNSKRLQRKVGQTWRFPSLLFSWLLPSMQRMRKLIWQCGLQYTLIWCDSSVPPPLSADPASNSHTRPPAALMPRTELYICVFNLPVSGLKTLRLDGTS